MKALSTTDNTSLELVEQDAGEVEGFEATEPLSLSVRPGPQGRRTAWGYRLLTRQQPFVKLRETVFLVVMPPVRQPASRSMNTHSKEGAGPNEPNTKAQCHRRL